MCVFFYGDSCIEDISTYFIHHLSFHPKFKAYGTYTVLRAIKELTVNNITYTSESGKSYDFNTADPMNKLLVKSLMATEELRRGQSYYLDFDHQFIETEKYDTKRTYKKFIGYSLGDVSYTHLRFIGRNDHSRNRYQSFSTTKEIKTAHQSKPQ